MNKINELFLLCNYRKTLKEITDKSITSVTIPKSVKEIGEDVFSWCTSLRKVMFPKDKEDLAKEFEEDFENCTIELV